MENGSHAVHFDNGKHSQDNYLTMVLGQYSVLDAVFDGLSIGDGKLASEMTARKLRSELTTGRLRDANRQARTEGVKKILSRVNTALLLYNSRQHNSSYPAQTTATVSIKIGSQLYVINIGDSPAYLFREGKVEELTTLDKSNDGPNVLTQAIGANSSLYFHIRELMLKPGDRILLATDGITDNIYPDELYELVIKNADTPDEAVNRLETLLRIKKGKEEGREDFYKRFKNDDRTAIIRYF